MFKTHYKNLINGGQIGTDEDFDRITKVLNTISLVTFIVFAISEVFNFFYLKDPYFYFTSSIPMSLGIIILFLNNIGKHWIARYIFAFIPHFAIASLIVTISGDFGQGLFICAVTSISCLIFKDSPKIRTFLIFYGIVSFLIPTVYVTQFGSIFPSHDIQFDELFVFTNSALWIGVVFGMYESKFRSYLKALKKSHISLQEKTSELKQFNYIASHDLKSPLTNIINFSDLLKKDLNNNEHEHVQDYISFIEASAFRMRELVEDVLEISKINSEANLKTEPLNLTEVLEKSLSSLAFEIKSQNVTINYKVLPTYEGYKLDFITLFQNLIQNGIKYNRSENKIIDIDYFVEDDKLILKFKDCLLYTSPSPRDATLSRMPSSA